MRFRQGYAPAPVCSPTRHSIQFGISPAKTRVTFNDYTTSKHCDPELALANLIKKATPGYATAHFGKWHVSVEPELCGYDDSDGNTTNLEGSNSKNRHDPKRVYGRDETLRCLHGKGGCRKEALLPTGLSLRGPPEVQIQPCHAGQV